MQGESLTPPLPPVSNDPFSSPSRLPLETQRVDLQQPPSPSATGPTVAAPQDRPLWVTWFAHPFANWFWFYFGFVAALSGSTMGYPSLGPVVMFGWMTGHLVNAKHPWGELKLFAGALGLS